MEKLKPTHGLTSKPISPNPKSMNPKTTNLMMDRELSLSTTGILHSLDPLNHENHHHHHHPQTMKINQNQNTHSQNLPIPDMLVCIGHFAHLTIALTTEEINLGIVENNNTTTPKSRPHSFTPIPSPKQYCLKAT